ncbi:MAG: hypothetical protein IJR02_08710 [Bacteroidaceae bacterium]|nr:hypothetical protein [Bacteroidaceae bacterium]
MIYLKIVLAILLSAIPLFFNFYIQPRRQDEKFRNFSTFISTHIPWLKLAKDKLHHLMNWLYNGMKRSDNFRKFFIFIMLFIMMAFQFVDLSAVQDANLIVENYVESMKYSDAIYHVVSCYDIPGYLLTTNILESFITFLFSILFLWYKFADWLLAELHENSHFYIAFGLTLIASMFIARTFIFAEILFMVMIAAYIYPNKIQSADPKGRKGIPFITRLKKAA